MNLRERTKNGPAWHFWAGLIALAVTASYIAWRW